ncbi:helix-turn-helix transcriptional regulator [Treponema sp.]|uniref:helix-turn-helix domain-containing protein n=1 Tax=Treponema sp. TaxID=166 RepID=UPI00298E1FC8|nr:helix-turn-helix transcriptional regulator [Treponema sp.]MCR5614071.1 helix-turn-helix domain-containing protein [Treponema sp.]
MDDIKSVLGKNIRELRIKSGWTQEKLAEKAGISVPFMTQIELARKSASLEVIQNLATALGVSYDRLFKTETSKKKDTHSAIHQLEKDLILSINSVIKDKFDSAEF